MDAVDLQDGPQRQAAESPADIIFFGGGKGGGKSRWGTHESAKWFDLSGHTSLIFRRTYPELTGPGSIWDETQQIYPLLGGVPVESKLLWRFDSGATVKLSHMQRIADAYAWNGKNIGDVLFEELTFFEEEQFWVILSCQRSSVGDYESRPRVRATMNPDPDSWVYKFVEWYLDDAGFADPEKSGKIRWFGRREGKLLWYDSEAEAKADGIRMPKSFTFIRSSVFDNPILLEQRPEYLANLEALPPVQQARYLGGNWKIRAQAGDYFKEEWFPVRGHGALSWKLHQHPTDTDIVRRFRMWDLAGTPWEGDTFRPDTPARSEGDEPDWTRGGLFGVTYRGELILLDMVSWRDGPGEIEEAMIATHLADGPGVDCVVGHDPGQAGNYQIENLEKSLRKRAKVKRFYAVRATKGKEEYAAVASRFVHRRPPRVFVQRADWNEALFRELEAFPAKEAKRDQVDVLSQAVMFYLEHPSSDLSGVQGIGTSRAAATMNTDARILGPAGDLLLP